MSLTDLINECIESAWNEEHEIYEMYVEIDEKDEQGHNKEVKIPDELQKIIGDKGKFWYSGGYDSPGYDIDIYSFAYIEKGELKAGSIEFESF